MNVQRLTLDLDKSSVPRGRVTIAQCDHDGTTVEAEIYDNGIALSTSGLSAYLVMRLPDGRHYYRVPATLDGHVATALVDEAYAATATGTTEIAYFELVGSGGVYSTSRFGVRVLPSATADATVPETWDGEVERLIQQLDEMAESSRVIINDLTTLEETVGAAEQGRVSAESGRVSAETARANAETARTSAESGRVSAEQGRVVAEQGRVTAESGRVTEFATLKAESQAATSAANTAAGNADAATTRANTAAQNANAAAANADATADGVESRVQEMAQDAAETATADAEQRIQAAIDAMGDISELAVPLMSADVRGGAKLEENGGLVLRDEKLGIGSLVQESDGAVRGGIAGLTAEGHAEQVSTTGKNLLPVTLASIKAANTSGTWSGNTYTINGVTFTINLDASGNVVGVSTNGTASANIGLQLCSPQNFNVSNGTYFVSGCPSGMAGACSIFAENRASDSSSAISYVVDTGSGAQLTITQGKARVYVYVASGTNMAGKTFRPQLELGSTATEYEPYTGGLPSPRPDWEQPIEVVRGYTVTGKTGRFVDLEVRDVNNQLLSTTPIPLPSRGWVGSLPDGTADVLMLDGAGKCEWKLKDDEVTFDGSENWSIQSPATHKRFTSVALVDVVKRTASVSNLPNVYASLFPQLSSSDSWNNNVPSVSIETSGLVMFVNPSITDLGSWTTWLSQNPVTVLYPLATPVTEDCGYCEDWPTNIPEGAVIDIPELSEVGIKFFIDSSVTELAKQWYARANSEYADRITALEEAVAQLVTG